MKDAFRQIAEKLKQADALIISASNGLSITEGLHLFADNEIFEELFGDFKRKYGLRCILQGMGAAWPSEQEKWTFWCRLINHFCVQYRPTQVMQDLKAVVGDTDYFIVTSNGEGHFAMSGFSPEKIWEVEGSWLWMQCANGCHTRLYPVLDRVREMAGAMQDGLVPNELVPHCPKCGGRMTVQIAGGQLMPDTAAQKRWEDFLLRSHGKKIVVLELGIGKHNQLIKAPLMRLVGMEPNACYVTINLGEVYIPDAIRAKSFGLDGSLDEQLSALRTACQEIR